MKNAIISFGFFVCIILCFILHSVVTAKDVSANESEKTLSIAVEQALGSMSIKPVRYMDELNILISELGENIQKQLSSDSELEIHLKEADWINAEFKLEFTEKIPLSNGNISTVSVVKNIHTENYVYDEKNFEDSEETTETTEEN